jgi:hypothetical protein
LNSPAQLFTHNLTRVVPSGQDGVDNLSSP